MTRRTPRSPAPAKAFPAVRVGKPCPVCGKPATAVSHPFCSTRCTDVDLHRWLGGTYVVAGTVEADDEPSDGDGD